MLNNLFRDNKTNLINQLTSVELLDGLNKGHSYSEIVKNTIINYFMHIDLTYYNNNDEDLENDLDLIYDKVKMEFGKKYEDIIINCFKQDNNLMIIFRNVIIPNIYYVNYINEALFNDIKAVVKIQYTNMYISPIQLNLTNITPFNIDDFEYLHNIKNNMNHYLINITEPKILNPDLTLDMMIKFNEKEKEESLIYIKQDTETNQYNLIKSILFELPDKYYTEYQYWLRIGFILKKIGNEMNQSDKYLNLFTSFSDKSNSHSGNNYNAIDSIFNGSSNSNLNISTLYYYYILEFGKDKFKELLKHYKMHKEPVKKSKSITFFIQNGKTLDSFIFDIRDCIDNHNLSDDFEKEDEIELTKDIKGITYKDICNIIEGLRNYIIMTESKIMVKSENESGESILIKEYDFEKFKSKYKYSKFEYYELTQDKKKKISLNKKEISLFDLIKNNRSKYQYKKIIFRPYNKHNIPEEKTNDKIISKFIPSDVQYTNYNMNSIQDILNHIKILCMNNDDYYTHFIKTLAYKLYYPEEKLDICYNFVSNEGTGKSLLMSLIMKLFGDNNCSQIDNINKIEKFNSLLVNKLFVVLNEAKNYKENKSFSDILKGMISEGKINIEKKGVDSQEYKDYAFYVILSNNIFNTVISQSNRRYVYFRIDDNHKSKNYFDNLVKLIQDKNIIDQFYSYLFDIGSNLDRIKDRPIHIKTTFEEEQKQLNISRMKRFIQNIDISNDDITEFDEDKIVFDKSDMIVTDKSLIIKYSEFKREYKNYVQKQFNKIISVKDIEKEILIEKFRMIKRYIKMAQNRPDCIEIPL